MTEEPLEIRLAWPGRPAQTAWITMRTPGHDFELAAGWVIHEGLGSPRSIETVAYCTDATLSPEQEFNVVTLSLATAPNREPSAVQRHLTSGTSACGVCGSESIATALAAPRAPAWQGDLPTPEVVRSLPERLREHQPAFDRTGGVHAAGLFTADGTLLVAREDVGRHNAVDKVTGARALGAQPTAAAVLAVSGRAGFELVQKAAAAGIGALVAVGAPTGLAVELAAEAGVSLYGFTSRDRTVQYV